MRTWGTTTTVLQPAGQEGKHRRFKGKYVNGKTVGQMIKITEFPGENERVDRYGVEPHRTVKQLALPLTASCNSDGESSSLVTTKTSLDLHPRHI